MDDGVQELNKLLSAFETMSEEEYNNLYTQALNKIGISVSDILNFIKVLVKYGMTECIDKPLFDFFSEDNESHTSKKLYNIFSKLHTAIHILDYRKYSENINGIKKDIMFLKETKII
jgi:hypothetical protein